MEQLPASRRVCRLDAATVVASGAMRMQHAGSCERFYADRGVGGVVIVAILTGIAIPATGHSSHAASVRRRVANC